MSHIPSGNLSMGWLGFAISGFPMPYSILHLFIFSPFFQGTQNSLGGPYLLHFILTQ